MNINWSIAKTLIQEGDILLFRAKPNFWSLSWWVAKYSMSQYSHVSLATIMDNGDIGCLEFRELVGSRLHPFIEELSRGNMVDVYRVNRSVSHIEFSQEAYRFTQTTKEFSPEIAKQITDEGKLHVSRKEGYAWSIIWKISGILIPIYRLFVDRNPKIEQDARGFVCSTFVVHLYRKYYVDLVKNISDEYTTPGDIASSNYLNYLFTITLD